MYRELNNKKFFLNNVEKKQQQTTINFMYYAIVQTDKKKTGKFAYLKLNHIKCNFKITLKRVCEHVTKKCFVMI